MEKHIINVDKEILGGTPVFYGTRVPIKNLLTISKLATLLKHFLRILRV